MKSKMVTAFAALMIALMAAGFAYSIFTVDLAINATVSTGTVNAVWDPGGSYHLFLFPAYGSISFEGWETDTLTVTASNLYPGAKVIIGIWMKNIGSLPIKVKSLTLAVTEDPAGLKNVIYFGIPGMLNTGGSYPYVEEDEWATGWNNEVYFKNTLAYWHGFTLEYANEGVPQPVIRPNHYYCVYGYFEMDSDAGDDYQGKSISFTLTLVVQQAVP